MALTITNSLITVQSGSGAVQSPANGATVQVDKGAVLTVALASTAGINRWTLQIMAPSYPALHQKTFDWAPGNVNGFQIFLPAEDIVGPSVLAGVEFISMVSDGSGGSIPSSTYFLQTKGAGAAGTAMQLNADYVIVAALPAYTNVNGTLTGNANGAVTSTMADGATPAVGDLFLLEQGLAVSAADAGLYQLQTVGAAGAKFVAVQVNFGQIMAPKAEILVGFRGTVFKGTTWVNTLTGLTNVIGTASFTFYPRIVTYTSALVAGIQTAGASATASAPAVASVMSTSLTNVLTQRRTPNTSTATIMYSKNTGGMVAGGLGVGAASVFATVAAGTVNASDISTMDTTIVNPV